jgi:transcriptional regulator with XRE-family HTH domain
MDVLGLGEYIRRQRENSRLSLRKLARITGISGTYLSQVERGLRKPSAEIMQGIAKGLRVSAETLYVQAGILEDRPVPDVASAIMGDVTITERQKQALVQIYQAFREETLRAVSDAAPQQDGEVVASGRPSARSTRTRSTASRPKRASGATATRATASKGAAATRTSPTRRPRATARASKEA